MRIPLYVKLGTSKIICSSEDELVSGAKLISIGREAARSN